MAMNAQLYLTGSTVQQTTYKASDGTLFLTQKELKVYLREKNLKVLLDYESVGKGGGWSQQMFMDFLLENRAEVINVLGGAMFEDDLKEEL